MLDQANGHKPAVVVGISGGLGNQMFQYAAGRALAIRRNAPLFLDISWFSGRTDRSFALHSFLISAYLVGGDKPGAGNFGARSPWGSITDRIMRRLARNRMGVPIHRERSFGFDPAVLELSAPIYMDGYWQSEKYFVEFRDVISGDFSLSTALGDKSKEMLSMIVDEDAVCVHVRRGDYISNQVASKIHGVCPVRYYERGVDIAVEGLARPHCFVFSDDPVWVRANLYLPVRTTVVDINDADDAHRDIALMTACKRFVVANSSLSWWGAWLSDASDKRVVAPARWFNDPKKDTSDLIPSSWIRV